MTRYWDTAALASTSARVLESWCRPRIGRMLSRRRLSSTRVKRIPGTGELRGSVLLSYLSDCVSAASDDPTILGKHPNVWDSWLYANAIAQMGWNVDVIDWNDRAFSPTRSYDAVVALDGSGLRLANTPGGSNSRLILHLTTADPEFNNAAEIGRLENLFQRRGTHLQARRQLDHVVETHQAIAAAHSCLLIGNPWTLSTYPCPHRSKIRTTNVATSARTLPSESEVMSKPFRDDYLWFFGGGAVHKGLDLTLEAFASRPDLRLHVVGNLEAERDFLFEYRRELFRSKNIRYYGFLGLDSQALKDVMRTATFLVAPSCSESMSNAVAVAAANGLIPIRTPEVGISIEQLPGFEILLPTPHSIGASIEESASTDQQNRTDLALATSAQARNLFSRDAYRERLTAFLTEALHDL